MSVSLKLGLAGTETELPENSRIFSSESSELIKNEGRSVNGTLHTDFIGYKRTFIITWDVISEADKNSIETTIKEQLIGEFLSFIKTSEDGTPETIEVSGILGAFGALVPGVSFYNYQAAITLVEV